MRRRQLFCLFCQSRVELTPIKCPSRHWTLTANDLHKYIFQLLTLLSSWKCLIAFTSIHPLLTIAFFINMHFYCTICIICSNQAAMLRYASQHQIGNILKNITETIINSTYKVLNLPCYSIIFRQYSSFVSSTAFSSSHKVN